MSRKLNPYNFVLAASIVATRKTEDLTGYGCNALACAALNIRPQNYNSSDIFDAERDVLPENKFLAELFKTDAERETGGYYSPFGYWGESDFPENRKARVLGLLLAYEVAKEMQAKKRKR